MFRRNVVSFAQVARLNGGLQKLATQKFKAPLFLMIDQEGGLVTRLRTATPLPSALALAHVEDGDFVRRFAAASAEVLNQVGFNVNLAPVLDVSSPERDSFIGNRSFGDDPDRVTEVTQAFARGTSEGGVLPTAKHFPGHGGVTANSHKVTPRKLGTVDELKARDLVPFEAFAAAEYPRAIMTAHLSVPSLDPSGLPATYSSAIIGGQLRDGLGYQGLVITDDLEMSGAAISPDPGERAVKAFLAGNDMLMFAGTPARQRQAYDGLLRAVREGRVPLARLDESVSRILNAKAKLPATTAFDVKKLGVSLKHLDELSAQVLKTNFKDASLRARHAWPDFASARRVTVLSGSTMFWRKFKATYPGAARFQWLTKGNLGETARALVEKDEYAVYFASGQISAQWLNALPRELKAKFIVVNCNHPGEIADQDAFLSVFNVNSYFTDGGTWLGELLGLPPEVREPAGD